MTDIGNMNAKMKQAVVQLLHMNRVVQVFGVFRVDGDDGEIPQIPATTQLCRRYDCRYAFGGVGDIRWKISRQLMGGNHSQDIYARFADMPQYFRDLPFGRAPVLRPTGDFDDDLVAGAGAGGGFFGDKNFDADFYIGRFNK